MLISKNHPDETLTFKRIATKAKDGHNGYLYIHTWPTGYQLLIFEQMLPAGWIPTCTIKRVPLPS